MRHDVVREGAVPGLGTALGVHGVLGGGKLVEQVEGFDAGDELALEEGLSSRKLILLFMFLRVNCAIYSLLISQS